MTISWRISRVLSLLPVLLFVTPPPAGAAPAGAGEVYLVQGVVGSTWDLTVDGEIVSEAAQGKAIVGPLRLEPGSHDVAAVSSDGTTVERTMSVDDGVSYDVVLHLPVQADQTPVLTSFVNDRSAVPAGNTRLSVAHTAAVGPADIKVDGEVLFADVASGEELTVVVPGDTYRVAVVPAAMTAPPVLGPVDLAVPADKVMRVFAVGVAAKGTMDAVVHTMDAPVTGSRERPSNVPGGSGGPAYGDSGGTGSLIVVGLGSLAVAVLLIGSASRRRDEPRPA